MLVDRNFHSFPASAYTYKTSQITKYANKILFCPPTPKTRANFSMMHSKFTCCKLYISESRNTAAIDAIDRAARIDPQVVVITKFEDCIYNRVCYTLVSYIVNDSSTGEVMYNPIRKVLLRMTEAAFSTIELKSHSGTHSRMGVNDYLTFHPFGEATMEDAACLAKLVASDIGNDLQGMLEVFSFYNHRPYKYLNPSHPICMQYQCSFMLQLTQQANLLVQYVVNSATTGQITRKTSGRVACSLMFCQLCLM
jgi:hypothetical protein